MFDDIDLYIKLRHPDPFCNWEAFVESLTGEQIDYMLPKISKMGNEHLSVVRGSLITLREYYQRYE